MKLAKRVLTTAAISTLVSFSLLTAAPSFGSSAPSDAAATTVVSSKKVINPECVATLKSVGASLARCEHTETLSVGQERKATAQDLAIAKSQLNAKDFKSFATAFAAGNVQSKPYKQQYNNITDSETQRGTFYFDGVRA